LAERDVKSEPRQPTAADAIVSLTRDRVVFDRQILAEVARARKARGMKSACGIIDPGLPVRYEDYAEGRYDED